MSEIVFSALMLPWKAFNWWASIELSFGHTQSIPQYTTSAIFGCQLSFAGSKLSGLMTFATWGEYWKPLKSFDFPSPTPCQ